MEWTSEQIETMRAGRRGHHNPMHRDTTTWLRTGAETDGRYGLLHVEVEPGGEVPAHYHYRVAMLLRVLGGSLRVQVGHLVRDLRPGDEAEIPEEHLFRWRNPGDSPARFVVEVRPAHEGLEKGLVILQGLARDGRTHKDGMPRNPLYAALLTETADIHLPGVHRWLGPLTRGVAALAHRRGVGRQLEERYCS